MTKQEIECHFLQWALSVNILGFSCLSSQPYLCISANFLLATSERQLQILMQIYTELILDLSVKEWSTIKVFEAASAAHLNWSNWANQRRLTVARQKGFLAKVTCYLIWVILLSLEMNFLIGPLKIRTK